MSEALTNAVVHAYRNGDAGRLHVTAAVTSGELWVLIGDDGRGMHGWNDSDGLGIGLSLISLLDDDVARPGVDHGLDLVDLVTGKYHEAPGVRAHLLVFAHAYLDQGVAPQARALAAEGDRSVLLARPLTALDALVDVPDRRLVGGGATLLLALHAGILYAARLRAITLRARLTEPT